MDSVLWLFYYEQFLRGLKAKKDKENTVLLKTFQLIYLFEPILPELTKFYSTSKLHKKDHSRISAYLETGIRRRGASWWRCGDPVWMNSCPTILNQKNSNFEVDKFVESGKRRVASKSHLVEIFPSFFFDFSRVGWSYYRDHRLSTDSPRLTDH